MVKTEFGNFTTLLEGVKKNLIVPTNKIDNAATNARAIERKLRNVDATAVPALAGVEKVELDTMPDLLAHFPDDVKPVWITGTVTGISKYQEELWYVDLRGPPWDGKFETRV